MRKLGKSLFEVGCVKFLYYDRWKVGRLEGWKEGRMDGRLEGWKNGRMERWKDGFRVCIVRIAEDTEDTEGAEKEVCC